MKHKGQRQCPKNIYKCGICVVYLVLFCQVFRSISIGDKRDRDKAEPSVSIQEGVGPPPSAAKTLGKSWVASQLSAVVGQPAC